MSLPEIPSGSHELSESASGFMIDQLAPRDLDALEKDLQRKSENVKMSADGFARGELSGSES